MNCFMLLLMCWYISLLYFTDITTNLKDTIAGVGRDVNLHYLSFSSVFILLNKQITPC